MDESRTVDTNTEGKTQPATVVEARSRPAKLAMENSLTLNSRGRVYSRPLDRSWQLQDIEDPYTHFLGVLSEVRGLPVGELDANDHFDHMEVDITNNCNLRCPFCSTNFAHADNHRMELDVFRKAVQLISLLPLGGFFVSCAFEITLHRNFTDFIALIEPQHRRKAFFTTNLSVKLSDDMIERIARSNVGWVNVSIESFEPEMFETFRSGAKYPIFMHNLTRLAKALHDQPGAPKLRFISMLFKQNYQELQALIRRCHEEFHAYDHEVRLAYYGPNANQTDQFKQESFVSLEEFEAFQQRVMAEPLRVKFFNAQHAPYYWKMHNTKFIVD